MEKFWNREVSIRLIGIIATLAGIIVSSNSQLNLRAPFATPASTFLIHQTHPWGFSYSFTEHGRHGINSNSIVPKNPFVVPLGFSMLPQLPLVPLPILRNNSDTSSNSSTVTTTTALPIETTSISPSTEQATSSLPTDASKPEFKDANTAFFLSSPLSFSYGFTAFDNSPLPIPQIPFLGLKPNSEPPKIDTTDKAISNDITEPTEKAAVSSTTTTDTTTTAKSEQESTTSAVTEPQPVASTPVSEITTTTTTTTTESAIESESTTLSAPSENEQNFETETIAPTNEDSKPSDSKPLDKLKSEESDSADVAKNTPEATTNTKLPVNEVVQSSSTLATVEIPKANTIISINENRSEFSYSIKDETTFDEKSHEEQRNGDSVKGKYSVVEPDGSLRTVTYTADGDGFKADVVRKESYTKPFPVWKSSVAAAPGTISSTLSDQNVVSYYYNRFHSPPPMPQVPRNFGYGYYIVPNNWG